MSSPLIDWETADWLARRLASRSDNPWPGVELAPIVDDAAQRVVDYTGLTPSGPLPPAEGIGRREWVRANLASTQLLMAPMLEAAAAHLDASRGGPKLGLEASTSVEVGVVFGYMAKRVLGQYEFPLTAVPDPSRRPRLLFVLPNLGDAIVKLAADEREFVTWVALHEVTHAVQFSGVPWLHGYLAANVATLMASAQAKLERRRPSLPSGADLKRVGLATLHGDLYGMVASPAERATLARMQCAMAVIEGHAEHVMDAVAPELLPSLPALRAGLDARRQSQSALAKLINRLLGLELKMRQYSQGKAFCDTIVASRGRAGLSTVFAAPELLPSESELTRPELWLARTA